MGSVSFANKENTQKFLSHKKYKVTINGQSIFVDGTSAKDIYLGFLNPLSETIIINGFTTEIGPPMPAVLISKVSVSSVLIEEDRHA